MQDVIINPINNIYCHVTCEDSIAMELTDFFKFTVDGARFSPAYRSRHWDGTIKLFNYRSRTIYAGLTQHVIEFCKEFGYTYQNNTTYIGKSADVNDIKLVKPSNLPLQPRDYQLTAYAYAIAKKRSVIISPTASGKSLIIYLIVRHLFANNKKQGLLIVPTISLVEQMYKDFDSYGWNAQNNCQKIYQGMERAPSAPLIISTWQSIYDMPKKYFTDFDFVIGDEAHTFKAKSLTAIMTKLINCDYRIGTTGTLDGTKVNKLILEGLFGPAKQIVSTQKLIEQKHLANFAIQTLILKYKEDVCKAIRTKTYQEEIDFLVSHEGRNKFIRNLALSLEGNTLILYTYVEKHGKILHELIAEKAKGRRIFFVYGGTDVMDREAVREITDLHPIKDEIIFEFDDIKIKCRYDDIVTLSNGTTKKAKLITENDDIDTSWILNNKK